MALYIGLMSGTSMDAVDAVLTRIDAGVEALHRTEYPIPPPLHEALSRGLETPRLSAMQFWHLDAALGELFADATLALLHARDLSASAVAAIGCHGQTIFHAPDGSPPLSVQAGDPNIIAARTGITTVADFRRRDLALGGQGAPLAPAFHQAVFSSPSEHRCIVNIGGIANVSVLTANADSPVLGFDSGPGNTLLDLWCQRHTGQDFDDRGTWAKSGALRPELLRQLISDPYFQRPTPKSTGREHFNLQWLDGALAQAPETRPEDVQRTLVELTARTIAASTALAAGHLDAVYVCGGGTANATLMRSLHQALGNVRLESTAALGIPPKDVEGAAFAWLAHRTVNGLSGNLPSVTGARHDAPLGAIYPGAGTPASGLTC